MTTQNLSSQNKNYKEDFNFFWQSLNDDYAYFDKKHTDWNRVKEIYSPQIDTIKSDKEFVTLLESVFNEIYDNHSSLNTNTKTSPRLVPSGTDLWGEYIDGKPLVTDVRKSLAGYSTGVKTGMEIISVNDVPIDEAVKVYIGKSLTEIDAGAKNYALNKVLAGRRGTQRKFTLRSGDIVKDYFPDENGFAQDNIKYAGKTESRQIGNTGYIKINNCLYDNELIKEFDDAMSTMKDTKAMILDLRETPSGGNTSVARAILGWFVDKDEFYQKHELPAEEKQTGIKRSWMEIVSPREGKYYDKPLYVLAGHWTGSLGEGITIGFDGIKKGIVIGTKLAELCGAIYSYQMPNTKIGFSFPVEKLFHVNGTPRENYIPNIEIDYKKLSDDEDIILNEALKIINTK